MSVGVTGLEIYCADGRYSHWVQCLTHRHFASQQQLATHINLVVWHGNRVSLKARVHVNHLEPYLMLADGHVASRCYL